MLQSRSQQTNAFFLWNFFYSAYISLHNFFLSLLLLIRWVYRERIHLMSKRRVWKKLWNIIVVHTQLIRIGNALQVWSRWTIKWLKKVSHFIGVRTRGEGLCPSRFWRVLCRAGNGSQVLQEVNIYNHKADLAIARTFQREDGSPKLIVMAAK